MTAHTQKEVFLLNRILKTVNNHKNKNVFPFFWLHGESKEVLIEYINKVYEANIRSICIESRPHPNFLGEQWWTDLEILLNEAKKLDMTVWILDDAHFPTGYANGAIKEKYPERRKTLLTHRKVNTLGPQKSVGVYTTLIQDSEAKLLSVYAKKGNQVIDLSGKIGSSVIYFEVPSGQWDVYLIYETQKAEYNPDYINFIDKDSCDVLIETVYEAHYARFKEYFGTTIAGFFSDEPGFMNEKGVNNDSQIGKIMPLPWGEELKSVLKQSLGDDYLTKLDGLWYETTDSAFVRYHFMDACTKLYQKNFSENIGNWCRNRGVSYIGHVIEDRDSNARLGVGAGHIFRSMAGQDMAGVDVVLNQLIPGMDSGMHQTIRGSWDNEFFHYLLAKLSTSIAQIEPKKMYKTIAEVYGAYGWHEGTQLMKWLTDHFLVRGVNHFVPHAFSLKDFPDFDCPPHFYAHGQNPQFESFTILMAYLNKMTTLLDGLAIVPTVGVLYHAEAEWTGEYMLTQKVAKILTQQQIEFNVLPNDVFIEKEKYLTTWKQQLSINNCTYSALIIPESTHIHSATLLSILENADKGTKVIFINQLPISLMDVKQPFLLEQLKQNPNIHIIPKNELTKFLINNGLYEIKTTEDQPFLRYGSFKDDEYKVKMFFNEDPKNSLFVEIEEGIQQEKTYRYHAIDNLLVKNESSSFQLAPYESIVFIEGKIPAALISQTPSQLFKAEIGLGLPEKVVFKENQQLHEIQLLDYRNLSEEDLMPGKSGTFIYHYNLTIPEDIQQAFLEIADGYESIQVVVNGVKIPLIICPPYQFSLNHQLKKGHNQIEILVTNTMDKKEPDYFSLGEAIQPTGILSEPKLIY